jgi:glutamine amidotransferase
MRAACLDYGAGNLHSLVRGLERVGLEVRVETDAASAVRDTGLLVLPGVGAFGFAAARLAPALPLLRSAIASGLPTLGICLGLQLLFDSSEEGPGEGLGVFRGPVTRLRTRRVPHMGWTKVEGLSEMYFAHGYACRPDDERTVRAWAQHEDERFPAIVRRSRVVGVQFHPEKSSAEGLRLLAQLITEVTT